MFWVLRVVAKEFCSLMTKRFKRTESMESTLKRLGYRVTVETDSRRALAMFRETPHAFDLVITDHIMPDLTGTELSKELLAIRPGLPIIICTGYSEQVDEEKISPLGIKGFMQKPFTVSEISQAIRKALEICEGNREKAARMLGIGERTLYRKIKRYGFS